MAIDSKIRLIIENCGHIKIDEMMREALSANPSSYYQAKTSIGKEGDFITAPEISQLFGETIGFWAVNNWQELGSPADFALIELGPGHGTLMYDLLRVATLVPEFIKTSEIFLLEINQNFINKQQKKLASISRKINWIRKIEELPAKPCIIIGNEFFDALPIKQYIKIRHGWYENIIVCDPADGSLKFDKMELSKALSRQLQQEHPNARDGAVVEESIESLAIMRYISAHLLKYGGSFLTIDYGYDIESAARSRKQYHSTLQAIKEHRHHPLLASLGEADLTAHVDFTALRKAAQQQGIWHLNVLSQRDFLLKNGIALRHSSLKTSASHEDAKVLDRQLDRLISREQMGELFKVMEYSTPV